jgi:2-polyprenyl-6-methoxyphenol hydroxylase-like FAD-dependent oxidoreductase
MRDVAVIGAGQAGLLTAHGLLRAGYHVTLHSDLSGQQFLDESRPTGTAGRFGPALAYERELGLNHWDSVAPSFEGVHLVFAMKPATPFIMLTGRFSEPARAIDLRLQSARWMADFEERGGLLRIEKVDRAHLDQIAGKHDLTIVATGRSELSSLFERNAERSVYTEPQRHLAMIIVTNAGHFDQLPFTPVKFNFTASAGEAFWVPYHHKDIGPSWNMVFEAKPGMPMDQFSKARSGEETVNIAKDVIRELFPWDYEWIKDAELADENGWLTGAITPTVRSPVGRLPSGRIVTGVGDAIMALDPIAGQGANNGNRMARHLVEHIIDRKDGEFDEQWISDVFEAFYAESGEMAVTFNNLLLEPITAAGRHLLMSQHGSDGRLDGRRTRQVIADAFCDNFADPCSLTPCLVDAARAKSFIAATARRPWQLPVTAGFSRVARDQLRQRIGLKPVAGFW